MSVNKIETLLKETLGHAVIKAGLLEEFDSSGIVIEIPKDTKNGDYSSNVAMQLTRQLKRNPRMIAQAIVDALDLEVANIDHVEIAGPGFINLFMKSDALTSIISEVLNQKENYGHSDFGKGVSYDVEFVSANPTGDLHLGHARGASLGDSICRIMECAGYNVTREYYINDAGNQIDNLAKSLQARYHQAFGIDMEMPKDGYYGKDVISIANALKEEVGDRYLNDDSKETYLYFRKVGVEHELEKLRKVLEDFRVHFDHWFSETTLYENNLVQKAVEDLKERGYTYESEGALWFRTTDFGDDKDRVLVKSDGSFTYLTPDIAYHLNKLSRGYDYLVDLLGADHHGYINRIKASIQAFGYKADQLEIDIMQMVRLVRDGQEVKMSKRTGNAVTIRDLMDDIGVDATRYFFASKAGSSMFDFDLDLAASKTNDNPVYYAQYAHARMCSIKEMAQKAGMSMADSYELINHPKEIELLKHINEFRNVVIDSAKLRAPHKITTYIQKLASLFHSFYNECKVVDVNAVELSSQRLALVEATRITLKNALYLIGVNAPEKM